MICNEQFFIFFQYSKFTTYCYVRTSEETKLNVLIFSNSAFSRFFSGFFTHLMLYLCKFYRYLKNLNCYVL
jgi:hypothetical protein